jgi:hypothetical protein
LGISATAPLEKDVQKSVKAALRLFGFHISDFSQGYRPGGGRHGSTRQTPGIPDLYCQHRSLPVRFWVEVKRPGGKLTDAQWLWHEQERHAGGLVLTMTSGAEMAEFLREAMKGWKQ